MTVDPADPVDPAGPVDPAAVWREALEALEADLAETERLLLLPHGPAQPPVDERQVWTAPAAPLPASLAPRAADLLRRHREAADRLRTALAASRRQQRATSLADQRPGSRPVYVDRAV